MSDLLDFFKVLEFLFGDTETREESLFLLWKAFLTARTDEVSHLLSNRIEFSKEKQTNLCTQEWLKSDVDEDR